MFHLAAFAESIDPGGSLVNIAAVNDDSIFTAGDDIRVPTALPFLIGVAAAISASSPIQAQFQSPSLRQVANLDVEPAALGATFANSDEIDLHPLSPLPLRGDESINFLVNTDPGAAELHYGLIWLGDGAQQPITGEIYSVRATTTITAVTNAWSNGQLTFGQDLPVGNYDIVGLRVRSLFGLAARLNFIGGAWRPGVPITTTMDGGVEQDFRFGRMGVLGTFHTNSPPSIEVIGAAGISTYIVMLDLIARG